jgi:drug/metabolite transporter (DMT)-like permease
MWLFLALLTGFLYTAEELTKRYVLRAQIDTWAFSFFYSFIGSVVTLPFLILSFRVSNSVSDWLIAIVISACIVANNWLFFTASGKLEASLVGSVMKLRLVWIFLLGLIVLHEPFSWTKLLGTLLTVGAGLVIIQGFRRPKSSRGVMLAVAATSFNGAVIILAKQLLGTFSAISLTFFAFFLTPLIMNYVLMPHASARIRQLSSAGLKGIILTCALGALANLTLIGALSLADATSTVVFTEACLILILVGEHIFLKEREYVWVKVVSVILALSGALLIQLS